MADYARHNAPENAANLLEHLAATGQPVLCDQRGGAATRVAVGGQI